MSLRLRLTLMYTALVSFLVMLLSVAVYSMVTVLIVNERDVRLEEISNLLIDHLNVDTNGGIDLDQATLPLGEACIFQIWSKNGQLDVISDSASDITGVLDRNAITQDITMFSEVSVENSRYRVLSIPLTVDGQDYGWLQVGTPLTTVQNTQRQMMVIFSVFAIMAILVVGFVGWFGSGQALEPLTTMLNVTREITSSDDLSKRIPVDTRHNDEMNELALTFNQTLVRLERLFNAQRRFLADVSHELRTPLTVIKGNVGLMRMTKSIDEESLNSISSEADRLTRLVGDLLLISQAESGNLPLMQKPVELDQLLFEVFDQMKILSEGEHDIQIDHIEPAVITGDRDRLKQVFLNLGSNAVKYSPEGTKITLSLHRKREWVEVVIRDEGYGILKEELGRLFERFYRGDKSRTRSKRDVGYGLGLPIAYWIVRSHKGRIDVESEVNQGTIFTVRLPASGIEVPTRPLHSR